MATSTSFQENVSPLGMPAPALPNTSHANTMQQMMAAAMAKVPSSNPGAGLDSASLMMQYYQTVAEKCWGLNSPPGSDSSSSGGSTSVSINAAKSSPVTSQAGKKIFKIYNHIFS